MIICFVFAYKVFLLCLWKTPAKKMARVNIANKDTCSGERNNTVRNKWRELRTLPQTPLLHIAFLLLKLRGLYQYHPSWHTFFLLTPIAKFLFIVFSPLYGLGSPCQEQILSQKTRLLPRPTKTVIGVHC